MSAAIPIAEWTIEGVLLCPRCTLYLDFCGTPQDLQDFMNEHHCAPASAKED